MRELRQTCRKAEAAETSAASRIEWRRSYRKMTAAIAQQHRGASEGVSRVQVTSPCSEGLVSRNLEWFHEIERAMQLEARKSAFPILPKAFDAGIVLKEV